MQSSTDGLSHLQTAITAVRVTASSVVGWVRLFSAQKDKTTLIINDAMLLKNTISISRMSLEFHYAERVDRTGSIIIIFFVICKRLYASQWAHDVRLTLYIGWIQVADVSLTSVWRRVPTGIWCLAKSECVSTVGLLSECIYYHRVCTTTMAV